MATMMLCRAIIRTFLKTYKLSERLVGIINLMFVDPCIIKKSLKNPTRCNRVSKFISYLYEAQHVSGDTPPFIRSLKLH
jgi:hypothetical protein